MKGKSRAMEKDSKSDDLADSEEIFYPSFLFKEIIAMMVIFILVSIVLAAFFPVGLVDPADPTDNLYVPKPEWYFMSLYQLLKYFPGKLEAIATVVVPAGGFVVLLLLPFIDRSSEKRPRKRPIAMTGMVFAVLAIVLLTVIGLAS
jgi:quinol-cytochrome oxidoreductase complex cytochrome b subunit